MSNKPVSYVVETDVPTSHVGSMLDFIYQKYLLPQNERFADISKTKKDGESSLYFTVLDANRTRILEAVIKGTNPLKVTITPLSETVTDDALSTVKQDIVIAVDFFEEKVRQNTVYFAWREGEQIIPETTGKEKKSLNRLFLETQVLLFSLFIGMGLILFLFIGWPAPIILMAIQFVFVFYSNKLIERTGDWRITKENPTVHLVEYRLPLEEEETFRQKYPQDKLLEMKREVYEQTIAKKREIDCETVAQIFNKHGLACNPESISAKKVNAYNLVQKTADKFGFPMPKVVVSNTMVPNAAASGPAPSRGVVLMTSGLFAQLNEDEIYSVLGHEFGHLKGHDPLWLYGLMATEFLIRFYVLLPLFPIIFFSLLFFVYFWLVMTVIYFIAKFFEARADLTSAIVLGQPEVLAEALEKIGYKRLLYERLPINRIQEWVSLDPHPPMYFRVARLRKFQKQASTKHTLIQSAKEVTRGFIDSFS
jgi:heat shock protein HtpX